MARPNMLVTSLEKALSFNDLKPNESPELIKLKEDLKKDSTEGMEDDQAAARPPFTLLFEMGKIVYNRKQTTTKEWLSLIYKESRISDDKENPLSARVFCEATGSLSDNSNIFIGANIGAFERSKKYKKLREYYLDGLMRKWYHKKIKEAIADAQDEKRVGSMVSFPVDPTCSSFKFGNRYKIFESAHAIGPCYKCKRIFENVTFLPDRDSANDKDEGYPYGNCAEYYALSDFLRATTT
ncbi:uncharacterized protein LOC144439858 [Glandiceps talaboti]